MRSFTESVALLLDSALRMKSGKAPTRQWLNKQPVSPFRALLLLSWKVQWMDKAFRKK